MLFGRRTGLVTDRLYHTDCLASQLFISVAILRHLWARRGWFSRQRNRRRCVRHSFLRRRMAAAAGLGASRALGSSTATYLSPSRRFAVLLSIPRSVARWPASTGDHNVACRSLCRLSETIPYFHAAGRPFRPALLLVLCHCLHRLERCSAVRGLRLARCSAAARARVA